MADVEDIEHGEARCWECRHCVCHHSPDCPFVKAGGLTLLIHPGMRLGDHTVLADDARVTLPDGTEVVMGPGGVTLGVDRALGPSFTVREPFSVGSSASGDEPPGIPMLLRCPRCNTAHIDEGEWATRPHKTHRCLRCRNEWRPANVATVGVYALPETGAPEREK